VGTAALTSTYGIGAYVALPAGMKIGLKLTGK
jgi:hypothetical protein